MRPLIGVVTDPFRSSYADMPLKDMEAVQLGYYWLLARLTSKICSSVRAAGGIPSLLSATGDMEEMENISSRMDGFVFAGGEDIDPSFYGETDKGSLSRNRERDYFEIELMKKAIAKEKPIFGICRGNQIINVVFGGKLYQHIPDIKAEWNLHERSDVTEGFVHDVVISNRSYFPASDGNIMHVNSMHHQAADKAAPGLEVIAETTDGLIEGLALPGYKYLMGVQWHPECLSECDQAQAELFASLVDSA